MLEAITGIVFAIIVYMVTEKATKSSKSPNKHKKSC